MPVILKITQYDRGTVLSEFRATASSPKLEEVARTLKGASMLITQSLLKNLGREPVEVRDEDNRLRFTIDIESISF